MRIMRKIIIGIILTNIFVVDIVAAQGSDPQALCAASKAIKADPVKMKLYSVNNKLCKSITGYLLGDDQIDLSRNLDDQIDSNKRLKDLEKDLESVLLDNKKVILSFFDESNGSYIQLSSAIDKFMGNFSAELINKIEHNKDFSKLLSLAAESDQNFQTVWEISGDTTSMNLSSYEQSGICKTLNVDGKKKKYTNCKEAFDAISKGVNVYRSGYDIIYSEANTELLNGLKKEWNTYVKKARNQTWLDENIDFALNRKHYSKDHLVGPAKTQYFLLHPSLVYEWVDSEPEGQRDKASAALEIVGFNRWDARVPWGMSIMAVASDRENFEPVSLGIGAYIENKYSFGVAYRQAKDELANVDDDWSVYINIDLLNWGGQRKNQLDRYAERLRSF